MLGWMFIKKIILFIYIFFPFILGIGLFSLGIINLFSSLCLFLGGYILLKNTLDYRVVRKNKKIINENRGVSVIKKDDNLEVKKIRIKKRERIRIRKK